MLCNVVYGGHIDDERDWEAASSLARSAICDHILQVRPVLERRLQSTARGVSLTTSPDRLSGTSTHMFC